MYMPGGTVTFTWRLFHRLLLNSPEFADGVREHGGKVAVGGGLPRVHFFCAPIPDSGSGCVAEAHGLLRDRSWPPSGESVYRIQTSLL